MEENEIKSILVDISQQVWSCNDLEEAKKVIITRVENSRIEGVDKNKIFEAVNNQKIKLDLDKYLSDSILFFEGQSINNVPGYKPIGHKLKKKKPSKNYFTKDTETAIIRYNTSLDPEVKSRIYEEEIHYAFFKLTQNIIHTFKFYYTEEENLEDLQHEIIVFLLSKIHLFDPSKGAKAYSYFGTIVKRWLILYNQKNYKKRIEKSPVSELDQDEQFSNNIELADVSKDNLSKFIDLYVEYCDKQLPILFPDQNDERIADAILELFRKREHLFIFNKKALYIHIREIIDVKTPKITKIANELYKIFKSNYIFYQENGYTKFNL